MDLSGFKAYDVRGKVPSMLNEDMARKIGVAYVQETGAHKVVIGHDARLSGPMLYKALGEGLRAAGAAVTGIGLCGTEEMYHASSAYDFDGGIMVTGSHNPADENGLKFVRAGGVPISSDSGLFAIRDRIAAGVEVPSAFSAPYEEKNFRDDYVGRMLSFIEPAKIRPFRIVADAGNGCAGLAFKALESFLPCEFILLNGEPDGTFPNGIPNPLLPDKRERTARAVLEEHADFGIAWDGDFDRCFFYDENGRFIEGYYLVGMMAEALLATHPGAKIVHDPRLVWNTQEIVTAAGGIPVESKSGHSFMKECMRREDALYGGEMSAHHYYRDFSFCDSGMLPWLLVAQLLSASGKTLAESLDARLEKFPCSGEINSKVSDVPAVLDKIHAFYGARKPEINLVDGLSMNFGEWRFNLRASNTEPVLRLNVESRANKALLEDKTAELLKLIRG